MIHARSDYMRIQDPEGKIPDNEPVFLLRGQDACAAPAVRFWADRFEESGGDPKLAASARALAKAMEGWQTKKLADAPEGVAILEGVTNLMPEAPPHAD